MVEPVKNWLEKGKGGQQDNFNLLWEALCNKREGESERESKLSFKQTYLLSTRPMVEEYITSLFVSYTVLRLPLFIYFSGTTI